jgi:hypothetical protein
VTSFRIAVGNDVFLKARFVNNPPRFRTPEASVPRNFAHDVAREMLTAFVRSVASNLEDQPAVGESISSLLAIATGEPIGGEINGTVLSTRSALAGSDRQISRSRAAAQETVVCRAVTPAHAGALRRNLDRR